LALSQDKVSNARLKRPEYVRTSISSKDTRIAIQEERATQNFYEVEKSVLYGSGIDD